MGQAFDRDGNVLGEAFGATKREVFDKLNEQFKQAHEIRIRSMQPENKIQRLKDERNLLRAALVRLVGADGRPLGDRELQIKGEMLTCKHFNGVQHDECRANVNYRQLAGEPELGCMTRLPCSYGSEPKGGPRAVCEKRETWTRAEAESRVDAHEKAVQQHMRAFRKVHDDAKAKGFKKNHGGVSECTCPACGGTLRYSVAGYNGHIHAKCETKGCVSWME